MIRSTFGMKASSSTWLKGMAGTSGAVSRMRGASSASKACLSMIAIFFFSSRRRHTRLQGDWSSDVCSSDLPVRRPPRHGVAIHRRSKVADGFSAEIVDADEAVVPAMGNEGDLRTIGRPLGRIILPAHEGKLMRRHRAGHRRSPELPARGPNRRGAIGGELDVFTSFPRAIQ